MLERITLDMLTQDSVSYKKEYLQELNGKMESVGQPWRKAYVNSIQGREEVQKELPDIYRNAIFSVWGDNPTIAEEAI